MRGAVLCLNRFDFSVYKKLAWDETLSNVNVKYGRAARQHAVNQFSSVITAKFDLGLFILRVTNIWNLVYCGSFFENFGKKFEKGCNI